MKLSAQQIRSVQEDWRIFREISPAIIGDVFYGKLFYDYPLLRVHYPKDVSVQYPTLVRSLSMIIARLDRPEELQEMLAWLYDGCSPISQEHCQKLGETLIWTVAKGLGNTWVAQKQLAWRECVEAVIEMISDPKSITRNTD